MIPLKIEPAYKDYIWGGTRLKEEYGKGGDMAKVAESWELSCHKDGLSKIKNGPFTGKTLLEYLNKQGKEVLGTKCAAFKDFPILIKLIDAQKNLSVQVHPDNDYARRVENQNGKKEMWYIIDCEPGAQLLWGFKNKISKEEFKKRIEDNTLLDVVNSVPVKKGDVFFINSGTLHAIGKGILIAEIQQSSNVTYRIYDYGRLGEDGKPRELHIAKALDVTKCEPPVLPDNERKIQHSSAYDKEELSSCEYFTVFRYLVKNEVELFSNTDSFHSILCVNGSGTLEYSGKKMQVNKGDSIFIPAGFGEYSVKGSCEFLLTQI